MYGIIFIMKLSCFITCKSYEISCYRKHSSCEIPSCSVSRDSQFECRNINSILIIDSSIISCPCSNAWKSSRPHIRHISSSDVFRQRQLNSAEMRFFCSSEWCEYIGRCSKIILTRRLFYIIRSSDMSVLTGRIDDIVSSITQRCFYSITVVDHRDDSGICDGCVSWQQF